MGSHCLPSSRRPGSNAAAGGQPARRTVSHLACSVMASSCVARRDGENRAIRWDCVSGRAIYTNAGSDAEHIEPLGVRLTGRPDLGVAGCRAKPLIPWKSTGKRNCAPDFEDVMATSEGAMMKATPKSNTKSPAPTPARKSPVPAGRNGCMRIAAGGVASASERTSTLCSIWFPWKQRAFEHPPSSRRAPAPVSRAHG